MESPDAWAEAKLETPCEGMDQGELHSLERITELMSEEAATVEIWRKEAASR